LPQIQVGIQAKKNLTQQSKTISFSSIFFYFLNT